MVTFVFYKYIKMRHKFLHCQGLIKNVVFKSVALVTNKFIGYIRFCSHGPDV